MSLFYNIFKLVIASIARVNSGGLAREMLIVLTCFNSVCLVLSVVVEIKWRRINVVVWSDRQSSGCVSQ